MCVLPWPSWAGAALIRSRGCLPQVTATCVPVSLSLPERVLLEEGNVLAQGHQLSPEETQLPPLGRALALS